MGNGNHPAKTIIALIIVLLILNISSISAQAPAQNNKEKICAIYITGVGCPHCANTDPVILQELPKEYPNLIIIEYEIYREEKNGPVIVEYDSRYGSGLGIPLIIFDKDRYLAGDRPILQNVKIIIEEGLNPCLLLNDSVDFNNLDIISLPGRPNIWANDRILIKASEEKWIFQWNGKPIKSRIDGNINVSNASKILRDLLMSEDIPVSLEKIRFKTIKPESVPLSGKSVLFDNAIEMIIAKQETKISKELRFSKIFILALADTVNPCALAVFILFLIGIMSYDPTKGKKILAAGAAFVTAVYICYFIYGLIIIKLWQVVQALTSIRLAVYTILGVVAIGLGLLHLKNFVWYKPGGFATEMPIGWRWKVKKMMLGITSTKGAFLMGAFVTLFLMPCTMGPYLIAGGILSTLELIKTIPWLLVYNIIFILPLYGIVLVVYFGFKKVEDVSGWKDRNIKYLHLIIAIIMLFIGSGILLGWI